jgi:hypothetical protein
MEPAFVGPEPSYDRLLIAAGWPTRRRCRDPDLHETPQHRRAASPHGLRCRRPSRRSSRPRAAATPALRARWKDPEPAAARSLLGRYVGESVRHGDGVVELPLSTMTSSQEPAAGCFAARIDRIVRQGLRPAPRADDHRKVQVGHVEPSGSEWERRGSSTEGLCHGWKCVNRR